MDNYTTVSEYIYDEDGKLKKVKTWFAQNDDVDVTNVDGVDDDIEISFDDDVVLDQTVELVESPIDKVASFVRLGVNIITLVAAFVALKKVSGE